MSGHSEIKLSYIFIALGGTLFLKGLRHYKFRRRIKDIPRSKIKTAAIGENVEIHGNVIDSSAEGIVSPLTQKKGSAFIWKLERLDSSGKRRYWNHLYTFYSTPFLYVQDGGEELAAIDLSSCEFQEDISFHKVEFNDETFELPEKVKHILTRTSMLDTDDSSWFFTRSRHRLSEKVFEFNEPLFILGSTVPTPASEKAQNSQKKLKFGSREVGIKAKILSAFKKSKLESLTISQYDTNKNGLWEKQEEIRLFNDIEERILRENGMDSVNEYLNRSKFLFTKSNAVDQFLGLGMVYVSNQSEKDLTFSLMLKGFFGLIVGPFLIAFGVYILVMKWEV